MSRTTDRRAGGPFWWAVAAAPLLGLAWWGTARALAVRRARAEGRMDELDRIRRQAAAGGPRSRRREGGRTGDAAGG